jgi:hypothetical protein
MRPYRLLAPACLLAAAAAALADSTTLDIPFPVAGGTTLIAKIEPLNEIDAYSVFLTQGDKLTLSVADIGPTIGLRTTIKVFDPAGNDVTGASVKGQGERKAKLTFTAPTSGRFLIQLNGDNTGLAGSTGDYKAVFSIKRVKLAPAVFSDAAGGAVSSKFQAGAGDAVSITASTKKGGFDLTELRRPDGTPEPGFSAALKTKSNNRGAALVKFPLTGGDGEYELVGTYDAGSKVSVKTTVIRDEKKRTKRLPEEPMFDPTLPPSPSKGVPGTTIRVAGLHFDDIPVSEGGDIVGHVYPTFTVGGTVIPANLVTHPNGLIYEFPAPAGLVAGQTYDITATNSSGLGTRMTEAFFVVPPPTITGFTIDSAGPAGGRRTRILGTDFLKNSSVIFDITIVQPTFVKTGEYIDVVAPPHLPGQVVVKVRDEYGQFGTSPVPFTYLDVGSNRIVSVEPPTFEAMGGEKVVVKGEDFDATTILSFDGVTMPRTLVSSSQIEFVSPPHADGLWKLRVTDQYEQSSAVDVRSKAFFDVTAATIPSPVTTQGLADGWRAGRTLVGDLNNDGWTDVVLLRPEIAFGNDVSRSRVRLLLNDKSGGLLDNTTSRFPSVSGDEDWRAKDGVLADIDGDNDLDLAIVTDALINGGSQSSLRILKNNGSGSFTDVTATAAPAATTWGDVNQGVAIAAARLDAGNSVDLVIVDAAHLVEVVEGQPDTAHAATRVLLNDGTGVFSRAASALPAVTTSGSNQFQGVTVALADVNVDGFVDIAITRTQPTPDPANEGAYLRTATLLTNNGTASFTDVSSSKLPAANDRAPELVVNSVIRVVSPVTSQLASTPALRLFANDGQGGFTAITNVLPGTDELDQLQANAVAIADFDEDGDKDIVAVSSRAPNAGGRGARLLSRSGNVWLQSSVGLPDPSVNDDLRGMDVAVADLDGDGAADLVISRDEGVESVRNTVVVRNPLKDFVDSTVGTIPAPLSVSPAVDSWRARRVLVGDLDNDGFQDLVLLRPQRAAGADASRTRLRVMRADAPTVDGVRTFQSYIDVTSAAVPSIVGDEDWRATAGVLVDVELDGDLDLAIVTDDSLSGGARSSLRILKNNGLGQFTDATSQVVPGVTSYGDRNQGVAIAAAPRLFFVQSNLRTIFDLVVVHTSAFNDGGTIRPATRLMLNDGSGNYVRKSNALPSVTATGPSRYEGDAVLAGDVDADGRTDLLVFRSQPTTDPQNSSSWLLAARLLKGDGQAGFTDVSDAKLPAKSDPEYMQADRALFLDHDHDGNLDLLLSSSARLVSRPSGQSVDTPALRFFRNDGTGAYSQFTPPLLGATGAERFQADGVAIGDAYAHGEPALFLVSATPPAQGGAGGRLLARSGDGWTLFPRALPELPLSDNLRGSDVAFVDVDSDQDLDLVIVRDDADETVRNTRVLKSRRSP